MKSQKTPNSQSNPKKEKQSWRNQAARLQTTLQPSKQYGTGTKHKYRSMEQDRKPEIN